MSDLGLSDWIHKISPEFQPPYHLDPWVKLIERAATEPVRGLCAVPIRHYKTETTLHGIVWLLRKDPTLRFVFLTHSFDAAQSRGKRLRQIARMTNVGPVRGTDTIDEWLNDAGGGVVTMSAEQSKLGFDCHVLIFDDPLDEFGAEDPKVREDVDQTITHYTARCMRRGKPGPVLGVMSRWHPDDPIGRRMSRSVVKWEYVHASAIVDEGLPTERAFAPDVWPLEALKKVRAELAEKDPTERLWFAQLMNEPRPMGADLFGEPTYYDALPTFPYRKGFGIDMAYTSGDGSDWFARVVGRAYGPKLYVQDFTRHKIDAHLIESTCKGDLETHGRAKFFTYLSGPEVGMAKVLIERGIPIQGMQARYNKLVRAQRTIRRWNTGQILMPSSSIAPHVQPVIKRIQLFRGRERDSDDDETDALVSLSDGLQGGAVAGAKSLGKPSPY